jgi:hypothetical protein
VGEWENENRSSQAAPNRLPPLCGPQEYNKWRQTPKIIKLARKT